MTAPVGRSAVNPVRVQRPVALLAQQPAREQETAPEAIGRNGGGVNPLHGNEISLAHQSRVRQLPRHDPLLNRVPALGFHPAEHIIGMIVGIVHCRLPVPHLASGVSRVGQDRRDRAQRPCLAAAMRVALPVVSGRAGDMAFVEVPGDAGDTLPSQPLREDPADVRRRRGVRFEPQ